MNDEQPIQLVNRKSVSSTWLKLALCFIIHCLLFIIHCSTQAQSVLREGIWVKIGVTTSGVYRLDQATLSRLNPAFATADPRRLRLYGNGGAALPQSNATPRPADLTENAIQVTGEADGRFEAGDALLFYGQSPHVVRYDTTARRFTHQMNPYADTTFYFLTIGSSPGRRMATSAVTSGTSISAVSTFEEYVFYEKDLTKLPNVPTLPSISSGREWLGEYLTLDTTKVVLFDLPGLVPNSVVRLGASVVAGATVPTQFRLRLNDQPVGTLPVPAVLGREYDYRGMARTDTFSTELTSVGTPLRLSLTYQKNGLSTAQGYLNFLTVQVRRELRQYDRPTWVRRLPAGQYTVGQATAGLRVWNLTDPLVPVVQAYTLSTARQAGWSANRPADYLLFTDEHLMTPVSLAPVNNQNVSGQPAPNLLIITPAAWLGQAERLAKFRREHDQLSVLVVTTQQIYNEFGSGQPDVTAIRDASRYFYRKQPGQLRYLLLFGDATFDHRNIAKLVSPAQLANMVPVYESRESLHPIYSFSSDDYVGFMDATEGEWVETRDGDHRMDIGVGRLPVRSVDEAQTVVDKLIRYSADPLLAGDWQTKVMLIADDGDFNLHQRDVDEMATGIEETAPAYRPERIFLDNYVQDKTAAEEKAPAVNQVINRAFAEGRLIINYSGHGGVQSLAQEQVITLQDIFSWKNRRLPLFVTATCQFGRYDDPNSTSGAELALLSRSGGAIGLLTTTRPVFANSNLLLNKAFYDAVFAPVNGRMPRLGDVMRLTKNNGLYGPVNRNFALLGDPSMQLAYPQAQVNLTHVNGRAVAAGRTDTLRALQPVELTGEIQQQQGRLTDFSGTVRLALYDKATTQTTLGLEPGSPPMAYEAYTSPVYTGLVPVTQGRFSVRFTVPKDINYTIGQARLYAYATRTDSLLSATGSYDGLRVGGSILTDSVDTQPPVMTLAVVGGVASSQQVRVAGPDVTLLIGLSDNQGINIARSGLGHELTAQLDQQPAVVLNESYVATSTDGRRGEVRYTFRDLSPGTYQVRVKAWDSNNNSTGGALTLVVSERPGLRLRAFRASPNPAITSTVLTAELNRSGEPLDWTLSVYDLRGRLLDEQTGRCSDCPAVVDVGTWDGRTSDGGAVPAGLYPVRLQVRSAADGSITVGSQRLILTK